MRTVSLQITRAFPMENFRLSVSSEYPTMFFLSEPRGQTWGVLLPT